MAQTRVARSTPIVRTPRVAQLEGMFDLTAAATSDVSWTADIPLGDRPWSVGLIVGPSGAGKSTIARELFEQDLVSGYDWPADHSIVDGFPSSLGISEVTALLSSVGFSSPPAWLRPFHVLSNGEQFRVTMARALADNQPRVVVDEFTSVVDRTVAQIGSAAIAKTVRRLGKQFVAVTCHYDVEDWLQPDWVYQPHLQQFQWRELQRRPPIDLVISRCRRSAWNVFSRHHYLSAMHMNAARAYVATLTDGTPVAFASVASVQGFAGRWRIHRVVCLPDFQGIGIGGVMLNTVCALAKAATGCERVSIVTSHPSLAGSLRRSPKWRMTQKPSFHSAHQNTRKRKHAKSQSTRMMTSFEYRGEAFADTKLARALWNEKPDEGTKVVRHVRKLVLPAGALGQ